MQLNKLRSSRIIFIIMKTDYFFPSQLHKFCSWVCWFSPLQGFFPLSWATRSVGSDILGQVAQQILVAMQNLRNILSMHAKKSRTNTCVMHSQEPAASCPKIVERSTNISTCLRHPGPVLSSLPKVEQGTLSELVSSI